MVRIVDGERSDQVALARRPGPNLLRLGERSEAFAQVLRRRRIERIGQQALSDAPIGDQASGIGLQDILDAGAKSKRAALCGRVRKTAGLFPQINVSVCISPFALPLPEIPIFTCL